MSGRQQPELSGQSSIRKVTVTHAPGLHVRPCLAIVNMARRFQSRIEIRDGKQQADAGDILSLMSLAVPLGAEVALWAEGPDADEALDALVKLFSDNFGFND